MPGRARSCLRAHHALRHRRLGDEERARDLGSWSARRAAAASSATRASGASAGWQQVKISRSRSSGIVLTGSASASSPPPSARSSVSSAPRRRPAALAPDPVDRPVTGGGDDPGRRVVGHAVARPALERGRERVLDRLLGAVEVAEDAGERRDRLPRLAPEQAVAGRRGRSGAAASAPARRPGWPRRPCTGRTSIEPVWPRGSSRPSRSPRRGPALEDVEAAELLLGLGERPVGQQRARRRARARSSRWRSAAAPRRRASTPAARPPRRTRRGACEDRPICSGVASTVRSTRRCRSSQILHGTSWLVAAPVAAFRPYDVQIMRERQRGALPLIRERRRSTLTRCPGSPS